MGVLKASLVHKEVGFASTRFKNLLLCAFASGARGLRTSASGAKTSGNDEGKLASMNPTMEEVHSSQERVLSSNSTSRYYFRQELSLRSRGDHHQFRAQQKAGREEIVSAVSVDELLGLAEAGNMQALVVMLTGSPAKPNLGTISDCFVWLGRSGKQEASLALFKVLKKAGESEKILSKLLEVFISSFTACYGAEQAFISFRAVAETVQVRPNTILFENLIKSFCSQGQMSRAMDVLDEMQRRGLTLTSTCFDPLLKSFSDHLMLDEALETLAAMRRLGFETSLANYNVIVGACVRAGDMEKAYGVLNEMQQQGIQPDTTSFNHIIQGFGQEKRLKRALSVLREMESIGLKPNKDTYLVLLRACGTNKDLNEAMKLFKKVEELGLETDQTLLSAMIQVYVDIGHLDLALKLVNKLQLKGTILGVKPKTQLLRGLALGGRLDEARKVYEELKRSGKCPSPSSVATLLVALGRVGGMDTMLKIFQESSCSDSWSEYPVAYRNSYLNIFCSHICLGYIRHNQPEGAVKFLEHISKLGMTNSRTFYDKIFFQISNCESEGQRTSKLDAADGLAFLRAVKDQGVQLSRIAHETLLDHCASLGNSKEAWEIVQEMEKENLPLNIMSKIRLFRVFVAARKEHDAEKMLERISKFDLLDREVRLLLQKILELEIHRSEAGSAGDVRSFRHLLDVLKQRSESRRWPKVNCVW